MVGKMAFKIIKCILIPGSEYQILWILNLDFFTKGTSFVSNDYDLQSRCSIKIIFL